MVEDLLGDLEYGRETTSQWLLIIEDLLLKKLSNNSFMRTELSGEDSVTRGRTTDKLFKLTWRLVRR